MSNLDSNSRMCVKFEGQFKYWCQISKKYTRILRHFQQMLVPNTILQNSNFRNSCVKKYSKLGDTFGDIQNRIQYQKTLSGTILEVWRNFWRNFAPNTVLENYNFRRSSWIFIKILTIFLVKTGAKYNIRKPKVFKLLLK